MNFIMRWLRRFYLKRSGLERISPNDWIKREQINYDESAGLLTIKIPGPVKIFGIADTNSMDGLMDIGHNVVATSKFNYEDLIAGDIIIFQVYTTLIVHRIVKITEDKNGRIYRTRGDNNIDDDPWYLRDMHLRYLVVIVGY